MIVVSNSRCQDVCLTITQFREQYIRSGQMSNISVSELFRRMVGREAGSNDRAIIDHVFNIERGSESPEEEYDILHAFNLLMKPDDPMIETFRRNPNLHRVMFYYSLMRMNDDLVDDGWLRSYVPIYSTGKIGYNTTSPTIDREQYEQLMRESNMRFLELFRDEVRFTDDKFALRIIYASRINEELRKHPFSSHIHSTIREICHHEAFRFRQSPNSKITEPMTSWARSDNIQFYNSIEEVPGSDLFLQAHRLETSGAHGDIISATLGQKIPVFMKYSEEQYDIIHEYRVGRELNMYYNECPFVMYMYGLVELRMNQHDLDDYISVLDNRSEYPIEGDIDRYVLMAQWLPDSMPLSEFMNDYPKTFRRELDGRVVEVTHSEAFEEILMAILCTLRFLWDKIGFVHGDLHFDNIQIVRFNEPQILPLPGYPGRVFNLSAVPVLIDYGFSTVLRPNLNEVELTRAIIPANHASTFNPTEARLMTENAYIGDIIKILRGTYLYYIDRYSLRDLVAPIYYRAFTGESASNLTPEEYQKLSNLLTLALSPYDRYSEYLFNRLIPLGLTTYDPNGAIEEFVDRMYRYVPFSPTTEPTEYMSIDDVIEELARVRGPVITTCSGMVAFKLYGSHLRRVSRNLESVSTSFEDLHDLLQDGYQSERLDLLSKISRINDALEHFSRIRGRSTEKLENDLRRYQNELSLINVLYEYRYQIDLFIMKIRV